MITERVTSSNFECSLEDGYVYDRVFGKMTLSEAEKCTRALIDLARKSGYDKLVVNIDQLGWINDLSLRLRGMELFFEGSKVYKHIALVSTRPAITYLVTLLAKGGGFDAKGFGTRDEAVRWLADR